MRRVGGQEGLSRAYVRGGPARLVAPVGEVLLAYRFVERGGDTGKSDGSGREREKEGKV